MTVTSWLALGEVVWVIGLSAWIILERRSPVATLAWVLALAWLPVLGIFLYLLFGPRRLRRKKLRYRRSSRSVDVALEGWRERTEGALQGTPPPGNGHHLLRLAENTRQTAPAQASRVDLLLGGDACYDAMERAIQEAHHYVHLEYYIWEADRIGTKWVCVIMEGMCRGNNLMRRTALRIHAARPADALQGKHALPP